MENKWELLESSDEDREKIWKKNRTFAGDVWFRFRHKPTAVGGLILILVLLIFAGHRGTSFRICDTASVCPKTGGAYILP